MVKKILKSRRLWIVTIVAFVLLIVFFDRNSYVDRIDLRREIRELKVQRDYYLERIAEDSAMIEMLKDDDFLEKYAREHYLMLRDGDSVYVLQPVK